MAENTNDDMPPAAQSKLRALMVKAMAKYKQRKRDKALRKHAAALIIVAHIYDDKIRQTTINAQKLAKTAEQTPRPRLPSERDPDYDLRAEPYKEVADGLLLMEAELQHLQERIAAFHGEVKLLKGSYVPKKMMAKLDYDFLTLEIASGNLDVAMLTLAARVGEARRATT